jgi:hypothetical protein
VESARERATIDELSEAVRRKMVMRELKTFAGQNWLITPAALAVSDARPRDVHDQKWLLVLSGVAYANIRGTDFDEGS